MKQCGIKLIDELIEAFVDTFHIKRPIQDMHQVIEQLNGIVVLDCSMSEFEEPVVIKQSDNRLKIRIPSSCSESQRNFKLAKGLSFAVMEMGFLIRADLWNDCKANIPYSSTSEANLTAHQFAISLLLPKEEYATIAEQYFDGIRYQTTHIANYFKTPVGITAQRGVQLGLMSDW